MRRLVRTAGSHRTVSRLLVGAAVALCAATSLTACSSSPKASPSASASASNGLAPAPELQNVLDQSWASNGSRGFFVYTTGGGDTPVSLYDTAWWAAVASQQQVVTRLTSSSVVTWLESVLAAKPTSAASGMPRIEQIQLVVALSDQVGIGLSQVQVVSALNALRKGNAYRSDVGRPTDWASTAIAVRTLRAMGAPVPSAITAAAESEVDKVLARNRPNDATSVLIPALSILDSVSPEQATRARALIAKGIKPLTGSARLAAAATLASAPVPLRDAVGKSEVCSRLITSPDGVSLAKGTAPDPQLTSQAIALGCVTRATIPPSLPAGFPDAQALVSAPQATLDGLRVAASLNELSRYAGEVAATLKQQWSPTTSGRSLYDATAVQLVALSIGWKVAASGVQTAASAAAAQPLQTASLSPMVAALALGVTTPKQPTALDVGAIRSVVQLAAVELSARLAGDDALHRAVSARLRDFVASPTGYASAATAAPRQASVWGTIVGDWIMGTSMTTGQARAIGLQCTGLRCNGALTGDRNQPRLQVMGAWIALNTNDPTNFPLAV